MDQFSRKSYGELSVRTLTGWLILLIVLLIAASLQALSAAASIQREFRSLLPRYPSVSRAILVCQVANLASACASFYVAWVLYEKRPGTLHQAKAGLVVRCCCIVVGVTSFPVLAGLPRDMTANLVRQAAINGVSSFCFTSLWFLYLTRSAKVREIYADQFEDPNAG